MYYLLGRIDSTSPFLHWISISNIQIFLLIIQAYLLCSLFRIIRWYVLLSARAAKRLNIHFMLSYCYSRHKKSNNLKQIRPNNDLNLKNIHLIISGSEPYWKKTCITTYYNKTGINLIIFHVPVCGKVSIIRCNINYYGIIDMVN